MVHVDFVMKDEGIRSRTNAAQTKSKFTVKIQAQRSLPHTLILPSDGVRGCRGARGRVSNDIVAMLGQEVLCITATSAVTLTKTL